MVLSRFKPELRSIIKSSFPSRTQIQKQAMPLILDGKNTLVIAPTGSGKTETAFLPVLNVIARSKEKGIQALYIAPLRALNRDMMHRMEEWGKSLELQIEVRHGDTTQSQRSRQRVKPPHMLITTPETLQAILPAKVMRKHLESVKYVIIDEIHELVSDKRGIQLALGLERLKEACGKFQTIGLSATVGTPQVVADYYKLDNIIIDKSLKKLKIDVEQPAGLVQRVNKLTGKKPTRDHRQRIGSPKLINPAIPDSICRILEKMLMPDPAKRYPSYGQFIHDVRWALRGEAWPHA